MHFCVTLISMNARGCLFMSVNCVAVKGITLGGCKARGKYEILKKIKLF